MLNGAEGERVVNKSRDSLKKKKQTNKRKKRKKINSLNSPF